MKDRLLTFALALGAFALFYALFVPKPPPEDSGPALPLSTEVGPDGYQALWRWLKAEGVPVVSLRERYPRLPQTTPSASGNVLITTLPHRLPARPAELRELDAWVARGNTLIVMAALNDTPEWALGDAEAFISSLGRLTRLRFEAIDEKTDAVLPSDASDTSPTQALQQALQRLLEPQRSLIHAKGAHALLDGVQSMLAISELPASRWRATAMDSAAVLEIAQYSPAAAPEQMDATVWLKRQGDGQILTFGFASVFANKVLGEQDNARMWSNILAWSRAPDGAVIFDDVHQGAVAYYDAKAFFGDPRLHRTLMWVVLVWLMFVLGWQRLRPRVDTWNPVDVTTFIKVTGGFFAGALTPATAAKRLFVNFFNAIRRRRGLREDGAPLWDWLQAQAGVAASDLSELQSLYARAQAGRRVDLVRLQTLLSRLGSHA